MGSDEDEFFCLPSMEKHPEDRDIQAFVKWICSTSDNNHILFFFCDGQLGSDGNVEDSEAEDKDSEARAGVEQVVGHHWKPGIEAR